MRLLLERGSKLETMLTVPLRKLVEMHRQLFRREQPRIRCEQPRKIESRPLLLCERHFYALGVCDAELIATRTRERLCDLFPLRSEARED